MCFSIPRQIKSKTGNQALLDDGTEVDVTFVDCQAGDYVFTNGAMALSAVSRAEGLSMRSEIKKTYDQLL